VRATASRSWVAGLLIVVVCGIAPHASAVAGGGAREVSLPDPTDFDCSRYPVVADGSRRQTFDAFDAVGGIAAIPPRIVSELLPGQTDTYCVGFQNRGAETIDLAVEALNVAADDEGLPSSQREAADRGAARWLQLPTHEIRDLGTGDIAWLQVKVHVPDDAIAGSAYASVLATGAQPEGSGSGAHVQSIPSVAAQLFFDIPGDAVRSGRVVDVKSPRVIWWDGFDLGGLPVLERMRGLGFADITFAWKNTGAFSSDIGGQLNVTSDLSDKSVARLPVDEAIVLAGSKRRFRVVWREDIPLLGRFTPVLEVRGDSGRVERHELDPIWVIPSWWYIAALVIAIAIPVWLRRRSKRRYRELLARVEAAEIDAVGYGDDEDEWAP
jgi:hypothetical protein